MRLKYDRSIPATPFDKARAEAIWEQRGIAWSLEASDMTIGEYNWVHEVWETKPGNWSWMTTFFEVLNGRAAFAEQIQLANEIVDEVIREETK